MAGTCPSLSKCIDIQVNMVVASLPVSDRKLLELRSHTETDPQMRILTDVILQGWHDYRNQCQSEIADYWNYREELTVVNDLIMKGHKLVIPRALRSNMLGILHAGHFGVEKTLRRARDVLFWPKISDDIKQMVLNCPVCLKHRNANTKEPLVPTQIPEFPWQIVGTDLFTWENKTFIVVTDLYSHYLEVKELPNSKSNTVISRMKSLFTHWGIPEIVISDNGPCYSSEEFKKFAEDWDFKHETSSPHHSSGNGFSEAYVKICKQIFTKAKTAKTDPLIGLLEYRNTPLATGYSPAELLMGRQLRSFLPTSKSKLIPRFVPVELVRDSLRTNKQKSKKDYDTSAKPLIPLKIGDSARLYQNDKTWKQAKIIGKHHDRSYTVVTSEGAKYRRNRRHLIKTNECMTETPNVEIHVPKENAEPPPEPNYLEPPKQPPPVNSATSSSSAESQQPVYVTRSGRAVKPKVIESM